MQCLLKLGTGEGMECAAQADTLVAGSGSDRSSGRTENCRPCASEASMDEMVQSYSVHETCQVIGCVADLAYCKPYCRKRRVCEQHMHAWSVQLVDDPSLRQRFCQQCGKFQPLSDFDSNKRSCRQRLQLRRQRKSRKGRGRSCGGISKGSAGVLRGNVMPECLHSSAAAGTLGATPPSSFTPTNVLPGAPLQAGSMNEFASSAALVGPAAPPAPAAAAEVSTRLDPPGQQVAGPAGNCSGTSWQHTPLIPAWRPQGCPSVPSGSQVAAPGCDSRYSSEDPLGITSASSSASNHTSYSPGHRQQGPLPQQQQAQAMLPARSLYWAGPSAAMLTEVSELDSDKMVEEEMEQEDKWRHQEEEASGSEQVLTSLEQLRDLFLRSSEREGGNALLQRYPAVAAFITLVISAMVQGDVLEGNVAGADRRRRYQELQDEVGALRNERAPM